MPITELIYPPYKQDHQSLSELKQKAPQIFQNFLGVEGLNATFRGVVLEKNGIATDPKTVTAVLVLDWINASFFHNFYPKSATFGAFVAEVKPFLAGPATPELYESSGRSIDCTSSPITQFIKVKSGEETVAAWKALEEFFGDSTEKPSFYQASGIEEKNGVFLGLIGWKSFQEYERVGKESSFLDGIKALNSSEIAQNMIAQLTPITAV